MLNVVVIQTGNYQGHGIAYVHNLRRQVRKHLTLPHRFYVVTDDAACNYPASRVKPAVHPGWWEKLRLFKPGMFEGRVLFLDLDTLIVDNINDIAAYAGPFATLHDFWRPMGLGPAVMLFDPEWAEFIYREWAVAGFPMDDPRGDQGWLENISQGRLRKDVDILQELHPGAFVSYKTHCTNGIPADARVVCFHGKPRPHECTNWVTDYWKEPVYG